MMRTSSRWIVLAAVLAACGKGQGSREMTPTYGPAPQDGAAGTTPADAGAPDPATPPEAQPVPQRKCGGQISVWIRGVDAGVVRELELELDPLHVTGGNVVDGSAASRVDLIAAGSQRLGVVQFSNDDEIVASIGVRGGRVVAGERVAELDACTAPITVRFRPEQVSAERCHAVIHLALAASLADAPLQPTVLAFLPTFTLHF